MGTVIHITTSALESIRRFIAKLYSFGPATGVHSDAAASVRMSGDLTDGDAVTDLLVQCRAALEKTTQGLVVDLTKVEAADTKLVAALVIVRRSAAAVGVDLVLQLPRCVKRWLAVCRLESLLDAPDRKQRPKRPLTAGNTDRSLRLRPRR